MIVILGMMSIVSGSALILTGGLTKPLMTPGFNWIRQGLLFGVPGPLILMIATDLVLSVILARTRFGRIRLRDLERGAPGGIILLHRAHRPGIPGRNHPVIGGWLRRSIGVTLRGGPRLSWGARAAVGHPVPR